MSMLRILLTRLYQGGARLAASQTSSATPACSLNQTRSITSLCRPWSPQPPSFLSPPPILSSSPGLLQAPLANHQCQTRTYKMKGVLKRRCSGCYYVKRFGRLYIECTLKPRHRQMQLQRGTAIYKDDYSKGPWRKSIHWRWRERDGFYARADPKFVKMDWLKGRLGTEV